MDRPNVLVITRAAGAWNMLRKIRTLVYKLGFRPEAGSIFYSPSLHWVYAYNDMNPVKIIKDSLEKK